MDFAELQTEVKDWINFTAGVVDQDFAAGQVKKAINFAYKRELRKARLECGSAWFKKFSNQTWPASTATFVAPSIIDQSNCIWIEDITGGDPGVELYVGDRANTGGDIFWLDNRTLQWGTNGPASEVSLRFHYLGRAVELVNDADIPDLIPEDHHELLVLSAGVFLRFKSDEMAPPEWKEALNDLRFDLWKELSKGRPMSMAPTVTNPYFNDDFDLNY